VRPNQSFKLTRYGSALASVYRASKRGTTNLRQISRRPSRSPGSAAAPVNAAHSFGGVCASWTPFSISSPSGVGLGVEHPNLCLPRCVVWHQVGQGVATSEFGDRGAAIPAQAKALVLESLEQHTDARPNGRGIRQAEISRGCGFDWGDFPKATSSNQQYWTVALLKQLESEGKVVQAREPGPRPTAG